MNIHSRRQFLRLGLFGGSTLALSHVMPTRALARSRQDPHFFLQIFYFSGIDCSYTFDARPLALTAAGKIQNFAGIEPELWVGRNGGQCLVSPKVIAPLKPLKDYFSVLNGVHMAATFDGHEQNVNMFFTGSPFGGESFVPHLNDMSDPYPLDFLQSGALFAEVTNGGAGVPLTPSGAKGLAEKLKNAPPMTTEDRAMAYAMSRMDALSKGPGSFSKGSLAMRSAMERAPSLANVLKGLELENSSTDETDKLIQLVTESFRKGVTGSAIISITGVNLDAHDNRSAKEQPQVISGVMTQVAKILETLRTTAFDATRSYLDVTTVVVASEFGRTMRQKGLSLEVTGTNHNPLTNSIIVAGKGIKSGLVIGESDFQTAEEVLSGAHTTLDRDAMSIMGRPFDFSTGLPRKDLPPSYAAKDYLSSASVINTIYSAFGAPQKYHRILDRNGPAAPVVSALL